MVPHGEDESTSQESQSQRRRLQAGATLQLVSHALEKRFHVSPFGIIVRRQRENFSHAQVHPPLTGANVPNPFQQFVEVVGNARPFDGRILQPLVIHGEPLHQVFRESLSCLNSELRSLGRTDAVADGENYI